MAADLLAERVLPSAADSHAARLAAAGSGCHPWVEDLGAVPVIVEPRDLADAVHLLSSLHGRPPGLVELAVAGSPLSAHGWLSTAAEGWERERLYLLRLTAAVGPLPSTHGNAETEAAILAQRHALETLARSERCGCALGAAAALVSDWRSIRPLLDRAALRAGTDVPPSELPDERSIETVLTAAATAVATERAIRFGAEQILLQHRALWDLLEARSEAREGF